MQKAKKTPLKDDTRDRLLAGAVEIFAEVGYHAATTRDICLAADANIAAINYYFRDKLGLYTDVLRRVVETKMSLYRVPTPTSRLSAERAFRAFVKEMFESTTRFGATNYYLRLMAHELANPTPGLDIVVEKIMRPNSQALCIIIGLIIGQPADASKTRMCAQSVVGQIVHYFLSRPVVGRLWPEWDVGPERHAAFIEHVMEFSLAALKQAAIGLKRPASPRGRKSKSVRAAQIGATRSIAR